MGNLLTKKRLFTLAAAVFLLVAANLFFLWDAQRLSDQAVKSFRHVFNTTQAYILPISDPNYLPILNTNIDRPVVNAKSVLVYDTRSGRVLFSKNPSERMPIASLTKILSAVVVLERFNQSDVAIIGKESVKADGVRQDLYINERISVANLLQMMLVGSSNDAAYALAAHAATHGIDFVQAMNEKAAEMGMKNSYFLDPAGLNDQAYGTAEDMVRLVNYALRYDALWVGSDEKELTLSSADGTFTHKITNTDELVGVIDDLYGGKTGYTEAALGCLALVVNVTGQDTKVVSVVLGSPDRFGESKLLIDWVRAAYRWE
ncbi:MAG: serine hydrolase [Patescibacteria group bacterium]